MRIIMRLSLLILSLLLPAMAQATVAVVRYPSGTPVQVCQASDVNPSCGGGSSSGTVSPGTIGQEAVYTGTTTMGSGIITDNGTNVGISSIHPGTKLDINGTVRANAFITKGGLSTDFVKGDGSLDPTTYLSTSSASSLYVPYINAISDVNLNSKNLSNVDHLTLGPQDVSNAFRLFITSNSLAADTGIVLYDGGTNDKDFAMFINGSGYLELSPAGYGSPASGIISSFNVGIHMEPLYPLDVTGAARVGNNNLTMLFVDPDDLDVWMGDFVGSYGNHTYVDVNDNAGSINLNAGTFNFTQGTAVIGQTELYQTNGMQVGGSTPMSIPAEAAYSFKTGSIPSGSFTEGSGRVLSYAINEGQIGTRDNSIAGGIFRMDSRTGVGSGGTYDGNQSFIVYGSPTGGGAFNNVLAISFQTGETLLNADGGVSCVGLHACGSDKFDVNGSVRHRGNTTLDDATNVILGTSTGNKIGTSTTQKLAFWNTTPIVQPANTVAINDLLVNEGLRASGGFSTFTTNVGISSTAPGQKLDVAGTVRMTGFSLPTGASSGFVLTSNSVGIGTWVAAASGGSSQWVTSGTTINYPTGNVGINSTNPGQLLDVNGSVRIRGTNSLSFGDRNISTINTDSSGTNSTMIFSTSNGAGAVLHEDARFINTGNLGIGTFLPQVLLHVGAGGDTSLTGDAVILATTNGTTSIAVRNSLSDVELSLTAGSVNALIDAMSGSPLIIGSTASKTALLGGNVGIGSLSPGTKLDVNGSARMTGFVLSSSPTAGYVLTSNTVGTGTWMPITTNAVEHLSYQPGLLTAVNSTIGVYYQASKASTVDNLIGSAVTFSCVANPTITMYECGTSTTCASSPVTIGTVTVTAAGTATVGTVSNPAVTAGDYIGWAITAGTCASIDIAATAQIHSN